MGHDTQVIEQEGIEPLELIPEGTPRLWNRNFFLLWQGQFVSQLGSQAFTIAVMFWTMQATGSASLMGLIMMAAMLPIVVLGPVAGTVADWYSRRKIIIVTDIVSGVSVLGLAALMWLGSASTTAIVAGILAVTVLSGIMRAFFMPAITAAIPDLVPDESVQAANSLSQFSTQVSTLFGQGLGGVLFRALGAPLLFFFDGVSYLFSAISESFIEIPQEIPDRHKTLRQGIEEFKRDTREGLRYTWSQVGMRNFLFGAAALNFLVMPILVMQPFYVDRFLGAGAEWYGFLMAALSTGSIVGFIFAGSVQLEGAVRRRVITLAMFSMAAALAVLGSVTIKPVALAIMFVVGMLGGVINVTMITLMQMATPSELRGRVMGLMVTLSTAITPLGMAIGGIAGDLTGKNVPLIYLICGLLGAMVPLVTTMNREVRDFMES